MAMAARMPMIATTIISSMRVKPRWFPIFFVQNRIMVNPPCFFVRVLERCRSLRIGILQARCHRKNSRNPFARSHMRVEFPDTATRHDEARQGRSRTAPGRSGYANGELGDDE